MIHSNWIDHWVKAIQSGLVNSFASDMVRSYTDLAVQHAATREEHLQALSLPAVPQAHTFSEALPPCLQLKVSFVEGARPTMLDHMESRVTAMETPPIS